MPFRLRALANFMGKCEGHVNRGQTLIVEDRERALELAAHGVVEILEGDDEWNSEMRGAPALSSPAGRLPGARTSKAAQGTLSSQSTTGTDSSLKTGGPTLEEFIAAGYQAQNYPPQGYSEVNSPDLVEYRAQHPATSTQRTTNGGVTIEQPSPRPDSGTVIAGPVTSVQLGNSGSLSSTATAPQDSAKGKAPSGAGARKSGSAAPKP